MEVDYMARITDIYLVDIPAEDALIIKGKVSAEEIPKFIGEAFIKLEDYAKSKGVVTSDTPFLRIADIDSNSFEIIAGMTIPEEIKGFEEIENCLIPAGKRIFCYWLGDNSQMQQLYEEMVSFAEGVGYEAEMGFFEHYLNGPEYGVDKLLTKVVMFLK